MCGRSITLGVLALMVAADGAHGLRTRAPGRRCPPRPPTTILRRSARCVAQLLIVFVIHPGWSTSTSFEERSGVSERSARDRRGGGAGERAPGARGHSPWAPSAATIRARTPSVVGRPRARPLSHLDIRADDRRRELGFERPTGTLPCSAPTAIPQAELAQHMRPILRAAV